jgi:signal transduction histidine kinase
VPAPRRIPLGAVLSLIAVLTSLPLAAFAGVLIYSTWRHQQEQVDRQNIEVVRAISVAVDQEVEHTIAALSVLSTLVPNGGGGMREFHDLCARAAGMQDWEAVRLVTPGGQVLMSTDAPVGAASQLTTVDWVDAAVTTRRPSVSTARKDPVLQKWVVTIGVPVIDKQGVVSAVLGARLYASTFSQILQRQHAPGEGIAALLDQSLLIVARTRNEDRFIGQSAPADFVRRSRYESTGAIRTITLEGVAAYSAWNRSEVTGWTAGIALPADVVDRPTRRSIFALIGAAAGVTALGMIGALLIRRRLVDAQRATAEAARALARGEPIVPRRSSIAEIQDLATALSDAATILETRLRERDEAQQEAERQRTAAFEREQAARRAAEALSRAKDEFVATVSHELRTPLNAIFGWVTLLRSSALDPERQKQGLEVIHRNAAAQLALINDLLDMSRVLRGTMRLDMQPVDLATIVDSAVDALLPTAEARRIAVHVTAPRGVALVSGDQSRLQQIIFNLVSNSLKFTQPDGRIDVALRTDGSEAVLQVADTGEGIAPEFLPYVFDRFRQEASDAGRLHEGLGIGLSLVRHLSELHGGTISAASPGKGRGATFTLRLPLLGARAVVAAGAAAPSSAESGARALNGARVLVVDDDADARDVIAMVIQSAGGIPVAVGSVMEAKRVLETGVPDAIVSDIAMPGGSGYELARDLRGSTRTDALPLVAVTAYSRVEDRDRAISAGFDAHLGKPFEPRALVGLLSGLISERTQP